MGCHGALLGTNVPLYVLQDGDRGEKHAMILGHHFLLELHHSSLLIVFVLQMTKKMTILEMSKLSHIVFQVHYYFDSNVNCALGVILINSKV